MDSLLWGAVASGVIVAGAHTAQQAADQRRLTQPPITLAEYNEAAGEKGVRAARSLPWWDERGRYVGELGDPCFGCTVDALGFVRDANGRLLTIAN